jgi:hypothetical protein
MTPAIVVRIDIHCYLPPLATHVLVFAREIPPALYFHCSYNDPVEFAGEFRTRADGNGAHLRARPARQSRKDVSNAQCGRPSPDISV